MRQIPLTTMACTLGLLAALGACSTGDPARRGVMSVHQPVVTRTNYVYDVQLSGYGRLAPSEAERLSGWFQSLRLGYGDAVTIDADNQPVSPAFQNEISEMLAKHSLLIGGVAPITPGAIAPGAVRIVVSRTSAVVPNCPDWKGGNHGDFQGKTMPNYGCATNASLAAMVANPEDLVRGQSDNSGNTDRAVSAITQYRKIPTPVPATLPSGTQQ